MTKLANPCTKAEIINRLATNESSNQIAKDYNVSGQRIRQMKKENEDLINAIAQKLIQENLQDIYETIKLDVQTTKKIAEKANKDIESVTEKEFEYKKAHNRNNENLLRAVGIFPAQNPSLVFNQYNENSQNNTLMSAAFQKYIDFSNDNEEKMLEDSDGVN